MSRWCRTQAVLSYDLLSRPKLVTAGRRSAKCLISCPRPLSQRVITRTATTLPSPLQLLGAREGAVLVGERGTTPYMTPPGAHTVCGECRVDP